MVFSKAFTAESAESAEKFSKSLCDMDAPLRSEMPVKI